MINQAQKSLHIIRKCIRNEEIPTDIQLQLFDSMKKKTFYHMDVKYGDMKIYNQLNRLNVRMRSMVDFE